MLSQALHHTTDPLSVLEEAWRVLRPGGRVLILDFREHDHIILGVRERLGDSRTARLLRRRAHLAPS